MNDVATADMDGGWKQVIEDYTEEFFRFFFPEVHAAVSSDSAGRPIQSLSTGYRVCRGETENAIRYER